MSAASPGLISLFFRNDHYPSEGAYLFAIAEAMGHEYQTVAAAGIVLQIDCPDLAMGRHIQYAALDLPEFRKRAAMHVEALNHALANIPPEQLRMHLCWGNYEGPHHCDVPLADIIDVVFAARPSAISFEAANPRHGHEWTLFERIKLPPGKVLIPGVIESKSNFIEHPELIAQRLCRYAKLVGRENVMGGGDCGFGTWVGQAAVDPDVVWAKMAAMVEGARIASRAPGTDAVISGVRCCPESRESAGTLRARNPRGPLRRAGDNLRRRSATTAPRSTSWFRTGLCLPPISDVRAVQQCAWARSW